MHELFKPRESAFLFLNDFFGDLKPLRHALELLLESAIQFVEVLVSIARDLGENAPLRALAGLGAVALAVVSPNAPVLALVAAFARPPESARSAVPSPFARALRRRRAHPGLRDEFQLVRDGIRALGVHRRARHAVLHVRHPVRAGAGLVARREAGRAVAVRVQARQVRVAQQRAQPPNVSFAI